MHRRPSAALGVAALLIATPLLLAAPAHADDPDPSPSATSTSSPSATTSSTSEPTATASPTPSVSTSSSAGASSTATSSASASASATATPSASEPPRDPKAPKDAFLKLSPTTGPRLTNVLLDGSCTQLAPIEYDEEVDEYFGEQWLVEVTLSVEGTSINVPVHFMTDYDGTFSYPVTVVGRDAASSPDAGDIVTVQASCQDEEHVKGDKWEVVHSFDLSGTFAVNDDPTCPMTLPESTGELDIESNWNIEDRWDSTGTYQGDGWLPDSVVQFCYFQNPEYHSRPAQRFGAGTADATGTASFRTIGAAVTPGEPEDYSDDDAYDAYDPDEDYSEDEGDEDLRRQLTRAAEERGVDDEQDAHDEQGTDDEQGESEYSDFWSEKVAVIGTGADGEPRVLVADITLEAVPVSAWIPDDGPNGGVLAATGSDTSAAFRSALALLIVGAAFVLIVRRREEFTRR